jgi:hypothetical protein
MQQQQQVPIPHLAHCHPQHQGPEHPNQKSQLATNELQL